MIKGAMGNGSLNSKFGGKELQNNAAEIVFGLTYLYHLPDPRNLSRVKHNLLVKRKGQSLNPAVGIRLSPSVSLFISPNTHTWYF